MSMHQAGLQDLLAVSSFRGTLPQRVVLVTSPTSAAVKDMLTVMERRFPGMGVWIYPVAVQGAEAAPSMVKAMEWVSRRDDVDVVIFATGVGRRRDHPAPLQRCGAGRQAGAPRLEQAVLSGA